MSLQGGVCPGVVCPGGVCPGGVSAWGWCLSRGGGVCPERVCARGGWVPACTEADTPPRWTEWLTGRCKNITFPQLHFRTVINVITCILIPKKLVFRGFCSTAAAERASVWMISNLTFNFIFFLSFFSLLPGTQIVFFSLSPSRVDWRKIVYVFLQSIGTVHFHLLGMWRTKRKLWNDTRRKYFLFSSSS